MEGRGVASMSMDGNLSENWRFWKARFQNYLAATEYSDKDEKSQCAGTCENAVLFLTSLDQQLIPMEELQIVGISRHTKTLTLVTDDCGAAKELIEKLKLSDADFLSDLDKYGKPVIEEVCGGPLPVDDVTNLFVNGLGETRMDAGVEAVPLTQEIVGSEELNAVVCVDDLDVKHVAPLFDDQELTYGRVVPVEEKVLGVATTIGSGTTVEGNYAVGTELLYIHKPIASLDLSENFRDHVQTFMSEPLEAIQVIERRDLTVTHIDKPIHPPADSYLLTESLLTAVDFAECESLNLEASALIPAEFNSGRLDFDCLLNPTNKRNHPVNLVDTYHSIGCGVGNHFSSKNPMQTLGVLQARYFTKQPFYPMGWDERKLATKIVDLYFSECIREDYMTLLYDDAAIQTIMTKCINDIKRKAYEQSYYGSGGFDDSQARAIRFHLKSIFKPKNGMPDVYKAGQGISAWSTNACAMFCGSFRYITMIVAACEKENVITDSYLDEGSFIARVNAEFAKLPAVAVNGVTDGETFDANQNAFTQLLERLFLARLGVSEVFLEQYYSFRKDYKVVSSVAIGRAGTQKTSGEPGTLVNNGIVSKLISNFLVRGDGPFALVYKGDDFAKRQCNLAIHLENKRLVDGACGLRLKVNIGEGAEFCGLIYQNKYLFPSIVRKLRKIVAHRFRDYKHFCEYQASLRDWVAAIVRYGELQVVASNAELYGTTYDHMQNFYYAINSWSHVRREVFEQMVVRRQSRPMFAVMGRNGNSVVRDY